MSKPLVIRASALYQADDGLNFPEGRVEFGETRLGSDPLVQAHPEVWLPLGSGLDRLRAHAGGRHERANAANAAARAEREAHEAAHGPLGLSKAEGGSSNA